MNMAKSFTSAFTVNFVMLHVAMGINVGVGISDITGPAAEVPMVSFINCKVFRHHMRAQTAPSDFLVIS